MRLALKVYAMSGSSMTSQLGVVLEAVQNPLVQKPVPACVLHIGLLKSMLDGVEALGKKIKEHNPHSANEASPLWV